MHIDLCHGEGSVGRFDTAMYGTCSSSVVKSTFGTKLAGHIAHNIAPR